MSQCDFFYYFSSYTLTHWVKFIKTHRTKFSFPFFSFFIYQLFQIFISFLYLFFFCKLIRLLFWTSEQFERHERTGNFHDRRCCFIIFLSRSENFPLIRLAWGNFHFLSRATDDFSHVGSSALGKLMKMFACISHVSVIIQLKIQEMP